MKAVVCEMQTASLRGLMHLIYPSTLLGKDHELFAIQS